MIIFLDTETTGIEKEDRLIQLAYKSDQGHEQNEFFKPPLPIKIGAMATHHITQKMVSEKPPFIGSGGYTFFNNLIKDPSVIVVAHNARFDIDMLAKEDIEIPTYICTLKIARTLDSEGVLESHSLQYLRYYYDLDVDAKAHDAWGDILVLEQLFKLFWGKFQDKFNSDSEILSEMIRITKNPVLLPKMPFGKHKGTPFKYIPSSYLNWMLGQDFDGDILFTVKHHLGVK